jgi:maltose/moltooligosaccharide transporter
MPRAMRRLALIQFFSWSGLFVLWIYSTPVVAHHHFGGAQPGSAAYNQAGDWVGILFATYNAVAAAYAFVLPALARRFGREHMHAANLLIGGVGLAGFLLTRNPTALLASMVAIGIAWASILTMPYALLCGTVPYRKFGTYMGIFNFFIVLPQLVVSGVMGAVVRVAFPDDPTGVMVVAGGSLAVAAVLAWRRVDA